MIAPSNPALNRLLDPQFGQVAGPRNQTIQRLAEMQAVFLFCRGSTGV